MRHFVQRSRLMIASNERFRVVRFWAVGLVLSCTLISTACAPEPEPPAPLPATFTRGENAFNRGDYTRAIEAYRAFLQYQADEEYVPRALYKIALSQYRLKDYRAALVTLDELTTRFPGNTWAQADILRGDSHLALGNTVSALQAWAEAWRLANDSERPALRQRFDRVIEGLSASERERAAEVITNPTIRTWLERPPADRAAATSAPGTAATPQTSADALSDQKIGCLLPLSGPYGPYGQRSLEGIRLALGAERARLIVKDTRSDDEAAKAAFAELANQKDVVAIVGPLRSEVAAAVAPLAEPAQLPLLLLAQREGLANRYVVPTAMTRSQQADALAAYALRQRWRNVGVLAPDDNYGRAYRDKFRAALEQHGVRLAWADAYDPKNPSVIGQIDRVRERHEQGKLDAIFIPDTAATAVKIATAIRSAIPGIALLGSNDWNDPDALKSAMGTLDGAVFVAGFFAASARPATRAFVDAFRQEFGVTPDVFAAQGYDAGILLRETLRRGAANRDALADALRSDESVVGASGDLRVTTDGVARELFVLRIGAGKIEEVRP